MTPTTEPAVLVEREGDIAIVTINNPKRRNAISPDVKAGIVETFTALNDDKTCRAIVLAGAGGVFSSGGDLTTMAKGSLMENRARMEKNAAIVRLLLGSPKPIVAAVEGFAMGAGLSLAMACDYVVIASNAAVGCAFVKVGLVPSTGEARRQVKSGGLRVNDAPVTDERAQLSNADLMGEGVIKLSFGRKKHVLLAPRA